MCQVLTSGGGRLIYIHVPPPRFILPHKMIALNMAGPVWREMVAIKTCLMAGCTARGRVRRAGGIGTPRGVLHTPGAYCNDILC